MKDIRSYLIVFVILLSSCSDNSVQNIGNQSSEKLFYLLPQAHPDVFHCDSYLINSDGSDKKLFKDSLSVTSNSYKGKVLLGHIDSSLVFDEFYICNTDGTGMHKLSTSNYIPAYFILSPDGQKILFTTDAGDYLCTMNIDGSDIMQISDKLMETHFSPKFSYDGKCIAYFESTSSSTKGLFIVNTDGTNKRMLKDSLIHYISNSLSWSPDGKRIVFEKGNTVNDDICVIDTSGNNFAVIGIGTNPEWSPDNTKICFINWGTQGHFSPDLWIMNPDGSNKVNLTSSENDIEQNAKWSSDSKKIVYSKFTGILSVDIRIYDLNSLSARVLADSGTVAFWVY